MKTVNLLAIGLIATSCTTVNNKNMVNSSPLIIEKQVAFTIGGQEIKREGNFNKSIFRGWAEVDETGQTMHTDHAYVEYQKPLNSRQYSMIYIHGFGGSGMTWTATPDGREGFSTLMLRKGYPSYVLDLPGRGRAGKTSAEVTVKPQANEQFWFEIWRMGDYPIYNEGVQFPTDKNSFSQFFRAMTPNIGDGDLNNDVNTITLLANQVGKNIIVTHSAGGVSGWLVASANDQTKAIVAYEPGAYVFPEGEVPEPIDGLTGGTAGIPISIDAFKKLAQKPIIMYFGDYIPEEVTDRLGNENWRVRLQMGRKFVEAINRHGGNATLVELPKLGIKGNTHFLMSERNNDILADLLMKWLKENNLE